MASSAERPGRRREGNGTRLCPASPASPSPASPTASPSLPVAGPLATSSRRGAATCSACAGGLATATLASVLCAPGSGLGPRASHTLWRRAQRAGSQPRARCKRFWSARQRRRSAADWRTLAASASEDTFPDEVSEPPPGRPVAGSSVPAGGFGAATSTRPGPGSGFSGGAGTGVARAGALGGGVGAPLPGPRMTGFPGPGWTGGRAGTLGRSAVGPAWPRARAGAATEAGARLVRVLATSALRRSAASTASTTPSSSSAARAWR